MPSYDGVSALTASPPSAAAFLRWIGIARRGITHSCCYDRSVGLRNFSYPARRPADVLAAHSESSHPALPPPPNTAEKLGDHRPRHRRAILASRPCCANGRSNGIAIR